MSIFGTKLKLTTRTKLEGEGLYPGGGGGYNPMYFFGLQVDGPLSGGGGGGISSS